MPHLHLRTSANLVENVDVPDILGALAEALAAFETIQSADIKAYHTLHPHWAMGENAAAGFAHLTLSLVTGRDELLLQRIGKVLHQVMTHSFESSINSGDARLTVEVREMPKALYFK